MEKAQLHNNDIKIKQFYSKVDEKYSINYKMENNNTIFTAAI